MTVYYLDCQHRAGKLFRKKIFSENSIREGRIGTREGGVLNGLYISMSTENILLGSKQTRQVYNLFQDLWNWFNTLEGG